MKKVNSIRKRMELLFGSDKFMINAHLLHLNITFVMISITIKQKRIAVSRLFLIFWMK